MKKIINRIKSFLGLQEITPESIAQDVKDIEAMLVKISTSIITRREYERKTEEGYTVIKTFREYVKFNENRMTYGYRNKYRQDLLKARCIIFRKELTYDKERSTMPPYLAKKFLKKYLMGMK